MIRVTRQAELRRHAQALECWARARVRAIAELECEAELLADRGLMDEALRLRSAALRLRQFVDEERMRAVRLRKAAVDQHLA